MLITSKRRIYTSWRTIPCISFHPSPSTFEFNQLPKHTECSASRNMKSSGAVRLVLRRSQRNHGAVFTATNFHTSTFHRSDDDELEQQRRKGFSRLERNYSASPCLPYHATPVSDSAAIVLGLGAFSAACFAGASAVSAYRQWKEQQAEAPPEEFKEDSQQEQSTEQVKKEPSGPRENVFSKWFDVGGKYYEGGFEETMTKREAALILGVRESSSAQRIKEAHRKIMILNHPDAGGSTYLSGKINEAKELLLKGKDRKAKD